MSPYVQYWWEQKGRSSCRRMERAVGRAGTLVGGWEIYHLTGSPADPDRLYASQTSSWFGQVIQRSDDGGKTWNPPGTKPEDLMGPDGMPKGRATCSSTTSPRKPASRSRRTSITTARSVPGNSNVSGTWSLPRRSPDTVYARVEMPRSSNRRTVDEPGGTGRVTQRQGQLWQPGAGDVSAYDPARSTATEPHVRGDLGSRYVSD